MGEKAELRASLARLEAVQAQTRALQQEQDAARARWLDGIADAGLLSISGRSEADALRAARHGVLLLDSGYIRDIMTSTEGIDHQVTLTFRMMLTPAQGDALQEWYQERVQGATYPRLSARLWNDKRRI